MVGRRKDGSFNNNLSIWIHVKFLQFFAHEMHMFCSTICIFYPCEHFCTNLCAQISELTTPKLWKLFNFHEFNEFRKTTKIFQIIWLVEIKSVLHLRLIEFADFFMCLLFVESQVSLKGFYPNNMNFSREI